MQIETIDGLVYDGIFRVFSPRLELTLDVAHLVDPSDTSKIVEENVTTMIFPIDNVVSCSAVDTDLDYATKGKIVHLILTYSFRRYRLLVVPWEFFL